MATNLPVGAEVEGHSVARTFVVVAETMTRTRVLLDVVVYTEGGDYLLQAMGRASLGPIPTAVAGDDRTGAARKKRTACCGGRPP